MAKKVILKDLNDIEVLPITRGELVLDASGNPALHSTLFLATDSLPGLMSSEDKYKLDHLEESGPGANNKVAQINTTTDDVYRLLFSETADDTDRTEKSRKSANLTFNPSTGVLNLTGAINANGGTINSSNYGGLTISRTGTGFSAITYSNSNDGILGYIGIGGSGSKYPKLPTLITDGTYVIWNETNFNPADYLPLSGGTITGGSGVYTPLMIKNINLSEVWIGFQDSIGTCYIGSSKGVPSVNMGADNKTIIHSGNIGSQSVSHASTADKLKNKVKIWGLDFDGSNNIDGDFTMANTKSIQGIDSSGATRTLLSFTSNNDLFIGRGSSGAGYPTKVCGYSIQLCTNSDQTERVRISSSGNVGIGTTNPQYKLDVKGVIYTNSQVVSPYFMAGLGVEGLYMSAGGISWHDTTYNYKAVLIACAQNAIALKQPTTVDSTLSVTGTGTFNDQIISNVADGTAPLVVASTTKVENLNADKLDGFHMRQWFTNASDITTTAMFWQASGSCSDVSSMGYAALINVIGDTGRRWQIWNSRNNHQLFWRPEKSDMSDWADVHTLIDDKNISNYLPKVTDYYWANVLISKTSNDKTTPTFADTTINGIVTVNGPQCAITVNSSCKSAYADFMRMLNPNMSSTYHTAHLAFGYALSAYNLGYIGFKFVEKDSKSNMVTIGLHSADHILNVLANGNVGIGTTAPEFKLHTVGKIVSKSTQNSVRLIPDEDCGLYMTSSGQWIHIAGSGREMYIYNGTWDNKGTGNYNKGITISTTNNIGIGASSPTEKLHVVGNTYIDGYLKFKTTKNPGSNSAEARLGTFDRSEGGFVILLGNPGNSEVWKLEFSIVDPDWTTALFKVDRGGKTTTSNLVTQNTILSENYHLVYNCGSYSKVASSVTGAIVIKLPITSGQYDMVNVEISVYEYNSRAASKIIVGGHPWNGTWYLYSCSVIGGYDRGVRLGICQGQWSIILGTSSTVWNYPGIFVTHIGTVYEEYKASYLGKCTFVVLTSESGLSALVTPKNVVNATTANKLNSRNLGSTQGLHYYYAGGITASTNNTGGYAGPLSGTVYSSVLRLQSHDTAGLLYYRDLIFDVNSDAIWSRRVTNSSSPVIQTLLHSGNYSDFLDSRYYTETEADNRFVNVTGDNMTGNLTFLTDSVIQWNRNTDYAMLKFVNTGDGDTNSYLDLQTGDNGNEYIRLSRNAGGTVSEMASFKSDGARITGTVWSNGSGVYLRTGPLNDSHAHYDTNAKESHWFNKTVDINGTCRPYVNSTFNCGESTRRWSTVYGSWGNFTNLQVVNDGSQSTNDALAYFLHRSNNDWTVKIDCSTSYTYGLLITAGGTKALLVGPGSSCFIGSVIVGADAAPSYTLDVRGEICTNPYIRFVDNRRYCGYYANGKYLELYNGVGGVGIHLYDDGNAYVYKSGSKYTIWHAGNDGAGSGLDADTLDGYHEYSFLRYRDLGSNGGATLWNQIGIRSYHNALPEGLSGLYNYGQVVSLPGSGSRLDIFTNHVGSSQSSGQGGLWWRSGWNDDKHTWRRIIDSGNIGSQSVNYASSAGNADTVDNKHASDFMPASGAYISGTTVADVKTNLLNYFKGKPATTSAYTSSTFVVNFRNNSYKIESSSVCGWIALNPGYDNYNHGHFLVSEYGSLRLRHVGLGYNTWYGPYTIAYTSDIPTKTSQLTNDSGFITGSYYPLAGNANMSGDNKWIGSTMGGGTDYWRIGGTGTGDTGVCLITIGDNSNDYFQIVIADYSGTNYTALLVKNGGTYAPHFYESSDQRLKTNIQEILNKDNIPQIKEFDWKESGEHSYGLIAQELEEQGYSELVSTKDDGYKTVNYSAALSLIVGKLQVKIKELEKEIEILKNK